MLKNVQEQSVQPANVSFRKLTFCRFPNANSKSRQHRKMEFQLKCKERQKKTTLLNSTIADLMAMSCGSSFKLKLFEKAALLEMMKTQTLGSLNHGIHVFYVVKGDE